MLILGAGPIGQSILHICKLIGVRKIYIRDTHEYRLQHAYKHGAYPHTDEKVTVTFDCAGNNDSINKCILYGDVNSRLALVGIPEQDMCEYNPHKMRTKEMLIQNVRRSNLTLDDCVELFSTYKQAEQMITHNTELENIQHAFETVSNRSDGVIKYIINPDKNSN